GRAEAARGRVAPVARTPADTSRAVAPPGLDAVDELAHLLPRLGRHRDRVEQSQDIGRIDWRRPAITAAPSALSPGTRLGAPPDPACSRSQASRSWRRISSARALSRQPTTSTVLSLCLLYFRKY